MTSDRFQISVDQRGRNVLQRLHPHPHVEALVGPQIHLIRRGHFLEDQVRMPGPFVPCNVEAALPIRIESDVAIRFGQKKADELAVKATECNHATHRSIQSLDLRRDPLESREVKMAAKSTWEQSFVIAEADVFHIALAE